LDPITKTIRLSGSSERSIEDAISTVLGRAALTLSDIRSFRVVDVSGAVSDSGVPSEYRVKLDITFTVRESVHG
jgi:flavin-binding protein dodecin